MQKNMEFLETSITTDNKQLTEEGGEISSSQNFDLIPNPDGDLVGSQQESKSGNILPILETNIDNVNADSVFLYYNSLTRNPI